MDTSARLLGKAILANPKKFPIYFEVEYDSKYLAENPHGVFTVSARIERDKQLEFVNDERTLFARDGKAFEFVNVKVIQIKPFVQPGQSPNPKSSTSSSSNSSPSPVDKNKKAKLKGEMNERVFF
jgi:hypothetical protein